MYLVRSYIASIIMLLLHQQKISAGLSNAIVHKFLKLDTTFLHITLLFPFRRRILWIYSLCLPIVHMQLFFFSPFSLIQHLSWSFYFNHCPAYSMLQSFAGYSRHIGTAASLLHTVSSKKCHNADVSPPNKKHILLY